MSSYYDQEKQDDPDEAYRFFQEAYAAQNQGKIDEAIRRIDEGTYGYCEDTGEPINVRRLDARPIATLSIEAQERHERREKVYRDD